MQHQRRNGAAARLAQQRGGYRHGPALRCHCRDARTGPVRRPFRRSGTWRSARRHALPTPKPSPDRQRPAPTGSTSRPPPLHRSETGRDGFQLLARPGVVAVIPAMQGHPRGRVQQQLHRICGRIQTRPKSARCSGFDDRSAGPPAKQPTRSPAWSSADTKDACASRCGRQASKARRTSSDLLTWACALACATANSRLAGILMVRVFMARIAPSGGR